MHKKIFFPHQGTDEVDHKQATATFNHEHSIIVANHMYNIFKEETGKDWDKSAKSIVNYLHDPDREPPTRKQIQEFLKNRVEDLSTFTTMDKETWIDHVVALSDRISEMKFENSIEKPLIVDRKDGLPHQINCRYFESEEAQMDPNKPTMVVFHGNMGTGDDMIDTALFYKNQGWNVVSVTIGGYPGSDQGIATTEATTIQDAHAVLRDLESKGVKTIGIHGHSIGGTVAMHASQLSNSVKIVIADKTLNSGKSVAANFTGNMARKILQTRALHPAWAVRGFIKKALNIGEEVKGITDENGNPISYKTDGLDNKKKAGLFGGIFVAIGGNQDELMAKEYSRKSKKFTDNLGVDLVLAHNKGTAKDKKKSFYYGTDEPHISGIDVSIALDIKNRLKEAKAS